LNSRSVGGGGGAGAGGAEREQDVVAGFEERRLKGHPLGPDVVKSTLPNWSVPVVNVMSPFVLKKASE
jgi:hypothetical protein